MIELHVPVLPGVGNVATAVGAITDRLDAVVIDHGLSQVYPGHVRLTLAGNPRDLALATERAAKMGGKVD